MAFVLARNQRKSLRLSKLLTVALLNLFFLVPAASAGGLLCRQVFSQGSAGSQSVRIPWFEKINFDKVEEVLMHGKIVSVQPLKEALEASGKTNMGATVGISLVTFTDGTKAVWKPGPWNSNEMVAYQLARKVGSQLVPPTVFRALDASSFESSVPADLVARINGQEGSLQYFVKTQFDLMRMSSSEREQLMAHVPAEQRAERDIFNFVFASWDLHWGNILIDQSYSIVQIDNGAVGSRQMVRFGESAFIRRLGYKDKVKKDSGSTSPGPFPFEKAVTLKDPTLEEFAAFVRNFADPKELKNYLNYRAQFASDNMTMNVVLWDDGIWIQPIGFQNYGPILPPVFPEPVLAQYRQLTFESLREMLPLPRYTDKSIREILGRRDQILQAATKARRP